MNLRSARVVLRTRAATDILDLAAPFCLRGWRLLLPLAGVTLLPPFVICLAVRSFGGWSWPAVWCLAIALAGLGQAPFTIAYGELLFQDPRQARLSAVIARTLRRLPAFVIAYVVSRVLLAIAASFLVFWPFAVSAFFAVSEVVLLEGSPPFPGVGRSRQAVRGHGSSAFGIALVAWLFPIAGLLAAEVTGQTVVTTILQLGEPFGTLWTRGGTPYALAGFFLAVPLAAAARFLKYIDLRTRKEGWDIQLRFMDIANAAEHDAKAGPSVQGAEAA